MASDPEEPAGEARSIGDVNPLGRKGLWGADAIHWVEQMVYITTGIMLVVALVLALAGSGKMVWDGIQDWSGTETVVHIIDRLLFVLMLVEILHTVHASIRTGTLVCEPFLIVGLIACIRRVLVITLETSQFTKLETWNPSNLPLFSAEMLELGVLAILIVVLVWSIRLTRPSDLKISRRDGDQQGPTAQN